MARQPACGFGDTLKGQSVMGNDDINGFRGRAGIVQRVFVPYRKEVFELIASRCENGLAVASGEPARGERLLKADPQALRIVKHYALKNVHLFRGVYYLCWQAGLKDWLVAWDPDVVIVEANPRYLSTSGLIKWMHKRDRAVIGHGLGVMPLTSGHDGFREWGRRKFYSQFDLIIAYSSLAAEQYAALGVPQDSIILAHNAVSRRPTWPCPERPMCLTGPAKLLFVGRLTSRKRLDTLIHCCDDLSQTVPIELWIVGDGPDRERLECMSRSIGCGVRFFGDLRGAALAELFSKADLFVLPGLGGLAIQEAMAYGLPVIVGDGDGTQRDLVSEKNGWNVVGGDRAALSRAISNAISDIPRLRAMGKESYRIVNEVINIEAMAGQFIKAMNMGVGSSVYAK